MAVIMSSYNKEYRAQKPKIFTIRLFKDKNLPTPALGLLAQVKVICGWFPSSWLEESVRPYCDFVLLEVRSEVDVDSWWLRLQPWTGINLNVCHKENDEYNMVYLYSEIIYNNETNEHSCYTQKHRSSKKKSWVLKATYSLAAFNKVLEHTKLIHGGTSKSSGGKNGSWQQV